MAKFNWMNTPAIRGEILYDIASDKRICGVTLWMDGEMLQCFATVEDNSSEEIKAAKTRNECAQAKGKKALAVVLKKLIPILER